MPRLLPILALTAIILYAAAVSFAAAGKPLWFDELCTLALVRQPGLAALTAGIDTQTVPFLLLSRAAIATTQDPHFGLRLFQLLGIFLAPLFIYLYLRPLTGTPAAMVAALFPLTTFAFEYFYEARAYGILLWTFPCSLYCWRRARFLASRRLLPLAGLCLAASISTTVHYYGIFAAAALWAAELLRTVRRRKPDWPILLALGLPVIPLALHLPMLTQVRQYSGTFWAQPSLQAMLEAYRQLLIPRITVLGPAIIGVFLLAFTYPYWSRRLAPESPSEIPLEDRAAAFWLLWLPVIGFAASTLAGGGFHYRYFILTSTGLALSIAFLLRMAGRHAALAAAALLSLLCLADSAAMLHRARHLYAGTPRDKVISPVKNLLSATPLLPVVISSAHQFFPLAYYRTAADPPFFYIGDPASAIRFAGSDSTERTLTPLEPFWPLGIRPYAEFLRHNPSFLLISNQDMVDWLPRKLRAEGHHLQILASHSDLMLYQVTVRP